VAGSRGVLELGDRSQPAKRSGRAPAWGMMSHRGFPPCPPPPPLSSVNTYRCRPD